ncbi:hypothetical protein GCM10009107_58340 [Ideonella azotifigens]|uniref:Uncharacterized protein n=1 Tax=Ideonella azotifigens TaxID=513160 RepID=A0ABP3VX09_9BURK
MARETASMSALTKFSVTGALARVAGIGGSVLSCAKAAPATPRAEKAWLMATTSGARRRTARVRLAPGCWTRVLRMAF